MRDPQPRISTSLSQVRPYMNPPSALQVPQALGTHTDSATDLQAFAGRRGTLDSRPGVRGLRQVREAVRRVTGGNTMGTMVSRSHGPAPWPRGRQSSLPCRKAAAAVWGAPQLLRKMTQELEGAEKRHLPPGPEAAPMRKAGRVVVPVAGARGVSSGNRGATSKARALWQAEHFLKSKLRGRQGRRGQPDAQKGQATGRGTHS